MAGLWSRKFDYKNGENRVCKVCNEPYYTMKPINRCKKCVNANQRIIEELKRGKYKKKDTYPFNNRTNEAGARFCTIRTALSNAWKQYNKTGDKSYVNAHYEKQLKEITENGIMAWILDRRCLASQKEKHVKTKGMIRKEYPDTRGHYED
jgi:hypothetical protein